MTEQSSVVEDVLCKQQCPSPRGPYVAGNHCPSPGISYWVKHRGHGSVYLNKFGSESLYLFF